MDKMTKTMMMTTTAAMATTAVQRYSTALIFLAQNFEHMHKSHNT